MSANYVYIRSEPGLWTVGFYDPNGKWQPDSDHDSPEAAAERVGALNGDDEAYPGIAHDFETMKAENARLRAALTDILEWCENAKRTVGVEPYGLSVARTALRSCEVKS